MNGIRRWKKEYIHLSFEWAKKKHFGPDWKSKDVFLADWHSPWLHPILSSMFQQYACWTSPDESDETPIQNEIPTTKILIFIFPFVLSLRLDSNSKSSFFAFIFMQRWTQNDVHFLWRQQHSIRKRICVSSGFQFACFFCSSFLCLQWQNARNRHSNADTHSKPSEHGGHKTETQHSSIYTFCMYWQALGDVKT